MERLSRARVEACKAHLERRKDWYGLRKDKKQSDAEKVARELMRRYLARGRDTKNQHEASTVVDLSMNSKGE